MKSAAKRTIWNYLGLFAIPLAIVPMILGPMTRCLSFDSWNSSITFALGAGIVLELLYLLLPQIEVLSILPIDGVLLKWLHRGIGALIGKGAYVMPFALIGIAVLLFARPKGPVRLRGTARAAAADGKVDGLRAVCAHLLPDLRFPADTHGESQRHKGSRPQRPFPQA